MASASREVIIVSSGNVGLIPSDRSRETASTWGGMSLPWTKKIYQNFRDQHSQLHRDCNYSVQSPTPPQSMSIFIVDTLPGWKFNLQCMQDETLYLILSNLNPGTIGDKGFSDVTQRKFPCLCGWEFESLSLFFSSPTLSTDNRDNHLTTLIIVISLPKIFRSIVYTDTLWVLRGI